MEQGLGAPAPCDAAGDRHGGRRAIVGHGTEGKGEEARCAVKGAISDGRTRDARPRGRTRSVRVAVGGGKASKGRTRAVGNFVSRRRETRRTPGSAAGRNTPARSRRRNRRGGEKPRGRHAGRAGRPPPKGTAETRIPGVGLLGSVRWRGDLWTTPGEEVRPAGRTARIGTRRESRRQGQEGRARTRFRDHARPVVGTSRVRRQRRRRPRRGAVEPYTAEATGDLPPWRPPKMGVDGANPSARTLRSRGRDAPIGGQRHGDATSEAPR